LLVVVEHGRHGRARAASAELADDRFLLRAVEALEDRGELSQLLLERLVLVDPVLTEDVVERRLTLAAQEALEVAGSLVGVAARGLHDARDEGEALLLGEA
jgi:hypothetical protein